MSKKTIFSVVGILILISGLVYFINSLKDEKLALYNALAAADTLHKIDSTRYSKLSYQYKELDSTYSEVVLKKNQEIQSLVKLVGKVQIVIDTVWATRENKDDSLYWFWKNTNDYRMTGHVKLVKDQLFAIIKIDTMIIPIKLDVAYVKHTDDGLIEVQINTNNKFVVIDDITSYIKVPPPSSIMTKKLDFFAGGLIGKSWGIVGGIRYKRFYFMGTLLNNGYNVGVAYGF